MKDISSYLDAEGIKQMQKALNLFANGEMQHDIWSRKTHMMGFQGMKRWHRLQSKEDRCNRVELQHYIIDMFHVNLEPSWDYKVVESDNLESLLVDHLNWEIKVYTELANIGNALVLLELPEEAKMISSHIKDVRKEIERTRRKLEDFEIVNWDMSYIKLEDRRVHDKVKELEG